MRTRILVLLFLPVAALALLGGVQAPKGEQLKTEWSAFLKEYDAAYRNWLKPYTEAKTEEERANVKLDHEKRPAKEFLPRAAAFAQKAKGTEYGASAWMWVFSNFNQSPTAGMQKQALGILTSEYIKSDKLVQLAQILPWAASEVRPPEVEAALQLLLEKSPVADVRAHALSSLAVLSMPYSGGSPDQNAKAEKYLKRLLAEYPTSKAAEQAKGAIFELERLQIGMVAPDFEATDENGVKFKLSDYRGKVVIVDFWGFW